MFIKHGDGKIMTVLDEEELTEKQKEAINNLSKKLIKQSYNDQADSSTEKNSGR